jgi:hypothetical protein
MTDRLKEHVMIRSRWARAAAAATLVAAATAVFAPAAGATAPVAPLAANQAYVRGAHFSPDTAGVDVYLSAFSGGTSTLWLSDVTYGDVSGYKPITAGAYAVSMRPHGAASSTPAALTWTVNISPGSAYTAAAVGTNNQLRGIVLKDSTSTPGPKTGMVRVIQASSQAGHVSVNAQNGPSIVGDIAYGSASSYVSVPAGTWNIVTKSSSTPSLSGQLSLTVAGGSRSSVVLLDQAGGGLTVRSVVDASGATTVPVGSVSAGGGGTAGGHSDARLYGLLSLAALSAAALMLVVGQVRRRRVGASTR